MTDEKAWAESEETNLKVCPYCGEEFSVRKRFCPKCQKVVFGGEPHTVEGWRGK